MSMSDLLLAALLISGIATVVAWFVWSDQEFGPVIYYPHETSRESLVTQYARPKFYDWATNEEFRDLWG
jgi:hypothetical protein